MDKRFLAFVGLIILVFIGFVVSQGSDKASQEKQLSKPTNHVKGEGTSGVTLTEYGDFECPACGQYYPLVEQVYAKYKDRISFQFRHFPIISSHPNAFAASRAAEAASKQNKFWEMYDLLYTNQRSWSGGNNAGKTFEGYAQQLGLNLEQYKKDFASDAVNDAVQADMAAGTELGVDSTPTFALNGKKIESPTTVEAFSELLDEAIAKKQQNQ